MCFQYKDVVQYQKIMRKLKEQKQISQEDYEFLMHIGYPAKQLKLEEYVSH